ncbi:hypothetical protein [Rhizobium leguminosarum]|jgi:hypothetical protein|uniref:hypothetical protein n=1 Tax=Rhizobium leguminosarum TaxID=384 RepID=UPI002E0EFF92|nr:hypothetical protein U8Q02_43250 [Rhizobium leguminosarum]
MAEWLRGDFDSFLETAAFLAGAWELCDDPRFRSHCRTSFDAGETPDRAAFTYEW